MKGRPFAELSGPALAAAITPETVVLQPIGAVEHHGSHLPLATDALVAEAVARALEGQVVELDLLVLPTLSYGLSTEHIWAPGTVSLSPSTLLALLYDIGDSVARTGARRLAFLNTHGGNTHLLRVAAREIRARNNLLTFLVQGWAVAGPGVPPPDSREEGLGIHGSMAETSVMLHLRPDLVDMSKAHRSVPSWVNDQESLGLTGGREFAWLSNDFGPSGVVGDPTLATPALGDLHFASAVAQVASALAEVSRFSFAAGTTVSGPDESDGGGA
jgi:creatinine amidohydrolase